MKRATMFLTVFVLAACTPATADTPTRAEVPATERPVLSTTSPEPFETPSSTPNQPDLGPTIERLLPGSPVSITSIHMINGQEGWALGGTGDPELHVLRTQDGGQTWADVTPPEAAADPVAHRTAAAQYSDSQRAWVAFSGAGAFGAPTLALIWRTEDAGDHWTASSPLDISGLEQTYDPKTLTFSGPDWGWFLVGVGAGMSHEYVNLYRTSDGGTSWQKLLDPYADGSIQACLKTGLVFVDDRTGWLTGDCQGVAAGVLLERTRDGGTTWEPVALPEPDNAPGLFQDFSAACGSYDAHFFDGSRGILSVRCTLYAQEPYATRAYLYRTEDGGETWISLSHPGGALHMLTPETGFALGRDLFSTQDGGQHWNPIHSVTWDGEFSFVDALHGWAVARSDEAIALVRTENGGQTWELLEPEIRP